MEDSKTLIIRPANLPNDIKDIESLWIDYLTWGNGQMQHFYGSHPHHPKETVAQDIKEINKFQPPHGQLMLTIANHIICGLGSLKAINIEIGEIKRLYVDPNFRNIGAGKALVESLILEAKRIGYKKIRLDSPKFMEAAHGLYRKLGFKEIDAYPEVEIPEEFRAYLIFMELDLENIKIKTSLSFT